MTGDVSIDAGSALIYAAEKLLELLGKDATTRSLKDRIERRVSTSAEFASKIQCIGMRKPVSFDEIYQPTRLSSDRWGSATKLVDVSSLEEEQGEAIIWGPPGAGKSILLQRLFLGLARVSKNTVLLIPLRADGSVDDLVEVVSFLERMRPAQRKKLQTVLLVDGYDEITLEKRRKVSAALTKFRLNNLGRFFLTCRTNYEIIDLRGNHFFVEPFSFVDAERYITAFNTAYGSSIDEYELLSELKDRGFSDFLGSPLLLTFVCILKTSTHPSLPSTSLELINRALGVLTFRWDESRGVDRDTETPLDGHDRLQCLMRIAFSFEAPVGDESEALHVAKEYLKLAQTPTKHASQILLEIAQWYGIFVPASDGQWTFTHKTIHDYLAARYWVESGKFHTILNIEQWSTRVAYVACLLPDATPIIVTSLFNAPTLEVLVECVANRARFEPQPVAMALLRRFRNNHTNYICTEIDSIINIRLTPDFTKYCSVSFLNALIDAARDGIGNSNRVIHAAALGEILRRRLTYDGPINPAFAEENFKTSVRFTGRSRTDDASQETPRK